MALEFLVNFIMPRGLLIFTILNCMHRGWENEASILHFICPFEDLVHLTSPLCYWIRTCGSSNPLHNLPIQKHHSRSLNHKNLNINHIISNFYSFASKYYEECKQKVKPRYYHLQWPYGHFFSSFHIKFI